MTDTTHTFFTEASTSFPAPTEKYEIDVKAFLDASSHLAKFFGLLGKVFYPVESDISGNVKKLRTFLEQHNNKVNYVNDIVVIASSVNDGVAIDALLWLKRALEFTMVFMDGIVSATRKGHISEDLNPCCTEAYEKTLKNYHGWIAQQAFGLVSRFCPHRKVLLETLALNKQGMEEIIIDQMEAVLANLKKDLEIINQLYAKHNLHSDARV